MNIKKQLYKESETILYKRLEVIQHTISDIQKALQSETKSSAGDKHETGRAMLQLEREKAGNQLAELQKQIELLHKINTEALHNKAVLGSIVKTTELNYFISVSVGEIKIEHESFYAISAATPIGRLLISKEVGDVIQFRTQQFKIIEVL
ncbi:3-oxoacyl-ACP synthase [Winogradskyella sp. PC-19]|uniref:3-oxoacyl-ACP synthase n=1 Tax=unclassified Winogradskyella TaxID=2615021 RepID=UPI000B3C572C|nr:MULTISPECIES: 3-oxoacyl-ACP synthase [unclassified Winogradskyella]ARV09765.1 3-oxoacyl-ACP synthase [Winogradskyella sp. PC-19]RZN82586.1 MAG: 3-oxoacyl-ACP synthase [Winogradskyella sp.]